MPTGIITLTDEEISKVVEELNANSSLTLTVVAARYDMTKKSFSRRLNKLYSRVDNKYVPKEITQSSPGTDTATDTYKGSIMETTTDMENNTSVDAVHDDNTTPISEASTTQTTPLMDTSTSTILDSLVSTDGTFVKHACYLRTDQSKFVKDMAKYLTKKSKGKRVKESEIFRTAIDMLMESIKK